MTQKQGIQRLLHGTPRLPWTAAPYRDDTGDHGLWLVQSGKKRVAIVDGQAMAELVVALREAAGTNDKESERRKEVLAANEAIERDLATAHEIIASLRGHLEQDHDEKGALLAIQCATDEVVDTLSERVDDLSQRLAQAQAELGESLGPIQKIDVSNSVSFAGEPVCARCLDVVRDDQVLIRYEIPGEPDVVFHQEHFRNFRR